METVITEVNQRKKMDGLIAILLVHMCYFTLASKSVGTTETPLVYNVTSGVPFSITLSAELTVCLIWIFGILLITFCVDSRLYTSIPKVAQKRLSISAM